MRGEESGRPLLSAAARAPANHALRRRRRRAEILDYGYPQNSALDVLKMYINLGSLKVPTSAAEEKKMTSMITGARDWRRDGIVHRKNEVFLDVLESVNLLVSSTGAVLRNDVTGQVQLRCFLSGMPECKLGLNDKLVLDRDGGKGGGGGGGGGKKKGAGVELDDVQFHRCVQLGKFDADRTITFVPPDGEFELMKYRITDNVNLPFRLIPVIEEQGKTRVVMNIKAIANFSGQLFATNVNFKIPVRVGRGRGGGVVCPLPPPRAADDCVSFVVWDAQLIHADQL